MALVMPPGAPPGFGQPPWSGSMQSFGGGSATPPMPPQSFGGGMGPMSSFQSMPPNSGSFAGGNPFSSMPPMSPTPPMPPQSFGSMRSPGGMPPQSFMGSPGGMSPQSFTSMGPGGMPPQSFRTMGPQNMSPGGMMPPGTMPPGGYMQPPSTFPGGPGMGMRPPMPTGLHHGFGPSASFTTHDGAAQAHAMMKAADSHNHHKDAGGIPLGVEYAPKWEKINAIVGEYHAVYPSPETPQYLVFEKDIEEQEMVTEQRWCSTIDGFGTWGRANLTHECDIAAMNWKERLTRRWQWVYIHADGWQINFWDEDFWLYKDSDKVDESHVRPIASIDMRLIFAVSIVRDAASEEGFLVPWEVHVNFQTGYFPFRVKSEEMAQAWNVRIMQGVVEAVKIQQMRQTYQHELHLHDEAEPFRVERSPARARRLRRLWQQAVRAVEIGVRPPRQLFFDLYHLYDALDTSRFQVQLPHAFPGLHQHNQHNEHMKVLEEKANNDEGDGNLTMVEIEIMAKEFLEMKVEAVRKVVIEQEQCLYSTTRPPSAFHEIKMKWTIDSGRKLMDDYERQLEPKDFFDRVVNFHHRTDISREGRVDITEFMNAAPVFLVPIAELRREGLFFRAAMQSDLKQHDEVEKEHAEAHKAGKKHGQDDADCNQM